MSVTPRTDAIALRSMDKIASLEMIGDLASLARQLECELRAAQAGRASEMDAHKLTIQDYERENARLRDKLKDALRFYPEAVKRGVGNELGVCFFCSQTMDAHEVGCPQSPPILEPKRTD